MYILRAPKHLPQKSVLCQIGNGITSHESSNL